LGGWRKTETEAGSLGENTRGQQEAETMCKMWEKGETKAEIGMKARRMRTGGFLPGVQLDKSPSTTPIAYRGPTAGSPLTIPRRPTMLQARAKRCVLQAWLQQWQASA
jgi:hypothetical protein